MSSDVQRENRMAKLVNKNVYPLLPRNVRDVWDYACAESYTGYPGWSSAKCAELLESVDPSLELKPPLSGQLPHG